MEELGKICWLSACRNSLNKTFKVLSQAVGNCLMLNSSGGPGEAGGGGLVPGRY